MRLRLTCAQVPSKSISTEVVADRDLGLHHQRLVGEPVVVDRVLAVEGALGRLGDGGAHAALGVVLHLGHRRFDLVGAVALAELLYAQHADGIGGELGVEVADGEVGHAHIGGDQALEGAAVPVVLETVARGREAYALLIDVRGVDVEAGRAAAEIEMMRHRGAEAHDPAGDEDRREDEHVGNVLAALERVVVDQEVAFLQRLDRMAFQAGAQRLADRAELHGNELGLGHRVAVAVHQAGRAVARLAQDGRVGRADQLYAHLARRGDQRLADHGIVDGTQLAHGDLRRIRLSAGSSSAVQPGGTQVVAV